MTSLYIRSARRSELKTRIGFVDLDVPSLGLIIMKVAIHQQRGHRWAVLPGSRFRDEDGELVREDSGKIYSVPVFEHHSEQTKQTLSDVIVKQVELETDFFGAPKGEPEHGRPSWRVRGRAALIRTQRKGR